MEELAGEEAVVEETGKSELGRRLEKRRQGGGGGG